MTIQEFIEWCINKDRYGYVLYSKLYKDSKGFPVKARINGKMRRYKKNPNDFILPMKYGLYKYFIIDSNNFNQWGINDE